MILRQWASRLGSLRDSSAPPTLGLNCSFESKLRLERSEEAQPVFHQARHQKSTFHRLRRVSSHPVPQGRILEDVDDPVGRLFDVVHQETVHAVLDLMLDAANIATNDRSAFPHCLSDGQAEAFAERLLEYDRGTALQGVYQRRILDR